MTGEPATEAPVNGGRNYNGPKVTEACKGFLGPDGDWPSSAKAEGSLTARPTRRAGTKVGLSDPTVPSGRARASIAGSPVIRKAETSFVLHSPETMGIWDLRTLTDGTQLTGLRGRKEGTYVKDGFGSPLIQSPDQVEETIHWRNGRQLKEGTGRSSSTVICSRKSPMVAANRRLHDERLGVFSVQCRSWIVIARRKKEKEVRK
ncbi:hypothetical protein L1049_020670 [Liquidambar formosana]|uniref:Uncharacterized protein n=1 Tax=Liquidambar formosana TaxID=63359 RepID=A0AAP0X671_LIQFO